MNIELNKKQIEAFKEFKKAFKKCETAKITFYCVLGSMMPLNGNYIRNITGKEFSDGDDPLLTDITDIGFDYVSYPAEFADDELEHMAVLTERGLKKYNKEQEVKE
jgi:hypothetical protein